MSQKNLDLGLLRKFKMEEKEKKKREAAG